MEGKIFNAQEVQAMLNGSKVMFREVIKPQPEGIKPYGDGRFLAMSKDSKLYYAESPYQVGQKIFCKEKFKVRNEGIYYGDFTDFTKEYLKVSPWKLAQHMKQEQSRLTLQIKEIRVEKLSEISEKDLKLEGFKTDYKIMNDGIYKKDSIKFFREDWNATHKKPEEKFEANPFVFVYTTEVVK
jgi:hypothetical protein